MPDLTRFTEWVFSVLMQHVLCLGGVFGAAVEVDLAVAEAPPVMDVHRRGFAGCWGGRGEACHHHDIGLVGGERQVGEFGDVQVLAQRLEEVRNFGFAPVDPVPWGDVAAGAGRPVHVVGELVEDEADVCAAERLVHALHSCDLRVRHWLPPVSAGGYPRGSHRAPSANITETMYSVGQPVTVGPGRRLGPVPDTELGEDVGDVTLDGVHADPERSGYLGVGLAAGQQGQHFLFARA